VRGSWGVVPNTVPVQLHHGTLVVGFSPHTRRFVVWAESLEGELRHSFATTIELFALLWPDLDSGQMAAIQALPRNPRSRRWCATPEDVADAQRWLARIS
jgi:hypothetical protein